MKTTRKLVFMALFVGIEIVLTRVISVMPGTTTRISVAFIVYALAGMMFGPLFSGMVGLFGDLVGAILFPPVGGFAPGFTLSAFVSGFSFGFIKPDFKRIILVLIFNLIVVELLMNTYWLHLIQNIPMGALWITRGPGILINFALRIVILPPLLKRANVSREV